MSGHNTGCICVGCEAVRHAPSARSVNLYGLASGPGPVEAQWIRERWKALGGYFGDDMDRGAHISVAALFAAVRSGRIRL